MANILYTRGIARHYAGGVLRGMLERSTSTYTPNKDHDFVSDLTGFVEISVASYARETLASVAIEYDDTNDRVELDADPLTFGTLEVGQTVKALIIYEQTGGDDASPTNDTLIAYIDTDATGLLPRALGGGAFTITPNAEGLFQAAQA